MEDRSQRLEEGSQESFDMSSTENQGKKVKMLRCPNCGALYREGLLHCPYCRSVDDYQDESEYLEDLDDLKERLEDLPETAQKEHEQTQKKELVGDMKKILFRVGLAAGIFLLLVGAGIFADRVIGGNGGANDAEKQKEEYLWKQENFARLDELYEKKDYQGLLDFDRENHNAGIYDWEHYPLLEGLRDMEYLEHDLHFAETFGGEDGSGLDLDNRAMILKYELELLFFDKREAQEADKEIIRELSARYMEDLETRFALTPQELEELEATAASNRGLVYISDCREFLKEREEQ